MLQDKDTQPQPEPVDHPAARRRSRIYYGWYLLATAIVISIATSGVRDGFHVLIFPMREELQWSTAAVAVAMAIGQLMSGVTQPIIGHLFDRFNSRRVILICVVATGLATAGLYWTSHYWHLIFLFSCVLSVVMGGASLAILWPLAARWFVKRLGLALGLLTAGLSMGSMVWTPGVVYFISWNTWQAGWLALSAISLFLALPVGLKFLRNWPSDMGLKPDGDPETPMEVRSRGSSPALRRGRFEVDRWWRAFRSPTIWALLPVLAIGGFSGSVISQFVSFAVDQGYSLGTASTIQSVMIMLGGVGAVAGGWLADRFARKKVLGAIYLAQGMAFLALVLGSETLAGLWVFAVVAGLCAAAWMPIAFALIVDVYGLRALGAIWGIAFLCQQIGGLVGPVLIGLAYDFTGSFALPFVACASMQIIVSIALLVINERKYSGRYQAATGGEVVGN